MHVIDRRGGRTRADWRWPVHASTSYEEEDTCMPYEEEDTACHTRRRIHACNASGRSRTPTALSVRLESCERR